MAPMSSAASADVALFVDQETAESSPALKTLPPHLIKFIFECQLIPIYMRGGRDVVLASDLQRIERLLARAYSTHGNGLPGLGPEGLPLPDGAVLEIPSEFAGDQDRVEASVLSAAIANLAAIPDVASGPGRELVSYLCGTRIAGASAEFHAVVEAQRLRIESARRLEGAAAAQGTGFFGTKRRLASFLVESLAGSAREGTPVLDLMTGSGAASAAFAQNWPTWASDAQSFSAILAHIQGAGFSELSAARLLPKVIESAESNAAELNRRIGSFVEAEARAFAMRSHAEACGAYSDLMDAFPTLSNGKATPVWDPRAEVERRRCCHDETPYCLFLAYFANTYFGIRQALEIDSIRFGIESLSEESERAWAMGALLASVSDLSTGFGGHFAQPRPHPRRLSSNQLRNLMMRRRLSIADEFDLRLRRLGRESERFPREITPLPGPWRRALDSFEQIAPNGEGIVYFDPPYRREEYSRYYHALETLVVYSYPSATGSGLTPDKKSGERFSSEFFSRSSATLISVLSEVIRSVLRRGWTCCWSYSDQAAVQPADVIAEVLRDGGVRAHSFAAAHHHRGHGKSPSRRRVIEYLIIFRPD